MTPTALPIAVPDGTRITLNGTATNIDPHITRQHNPWATLTLTAETSDTTVQVLPAAYLQYRQLLNIGARLAVVALTDSHAPFVVATRIALIEEAGQ